MGKLTKTKSPEITFGHGLSAAHGKWGYNLFSVFKTAPREDKTCSNVESKPFCSVRSNGAVDKNTGETDFEKAIKPPEGLPTEKVLEIYHVLIQQARH